MSKRVKKTADDDRLQTFRDVQFSTAGNVVAQNSRLLDAEVIAVCRRDGKGFYEDCTEPGTEPWFLIKATAAFIRKGGYGAHTNFWEILIITADGESFFPVKFVMPPVPTLATHGGKFTSSDPRRHKHFDTRNQPLVRITFSYGSVSFECFGPTDRELVQRAVALTAGGTRTSSPGTRA